MTLSLWFRWFTSQALRAARKTMPAELLSESEFLPVVIAIGNALHIKL